MKYQKMIGSWALITSLLLMSQTGWGQGWSQILKNVASDRNTATAAGRATSDSAGRTVAIDGDYAVIGIPGDEDDGGGGNTLTNAGSALIFKKNVSGQWIKLKKITAADRGATESFGASVAIEGNIIVVGANQEDHDASGLNALTSAGAVYVFYKDQGGTDNWGQVKKLVADDRAAYDNLGNAVAISNNYIVAGASLEDEDAAGANTMTSAGAAYVFYKDRNGVDNWGQVKKLVAADRATSDLFGFSVSISYSIIAVGAYQEDEDAAGLDSKTDAGSVYLFYKDEGGFDNWGQVKKIVAADRAGSDYFGYAVSIFGNTLAVGAYQEDEDAAGGNTLTNAGSAYVFYQDQGGSRNWGQVQKLVAGTRAASDYFGYAIAIYNDKVVVGAYQEDEDANELNTLSNNGSAYVFYKNQGGTDNWGLRKKIVNADRGGDDRFGAAVDIYGADIIAGAYLEDHDLLSSNLVNAAGAAYVFTKGAVDTWSQVNKIILEEPAGSITYGCKIAVDGDYAVIGAPFESQNINSTLPIALQAGAAYLLKKVSGEWIEWKKLVASDRFASDYFGWSVAISGNVVAVGAWWEDEDASGLNNKDGAGSVYLFSKDQGGTDNWGQLKKLVAPDRDIDDRFGYSVALDGALLAVGAYAEDHDAAGANFLNQAGSAYIFSQNQGGANNWGFVRKIVPPDRAATDNFAHTVKLSGNVLVASAYTEDEDAAGLNTLSSAGSAYVFYKDQGGTDNWGFVKKLVAPDRNSNDYFSFALAISGNVIIAGAYQESEDAAGANTVTMAGSAYIFYKDLGGTDNWGMMKKIVASDRELGAYFGQSVSINGNTIAVGAYLNDKDEAGLNIKGDAGAAYVFSKDLGGLDNWGQVQKLVASDRNSSDNFGFALALANNTLFVAAVAEDEDADGLNTLNNVGSVYLFDYNPIMPLTWQQFEATEKWGNVQLNWQTSKESNNQYFDIEHSINGIQWTKIGRVKSSYTQRYQFVHQQPGKGHHYYRIQQVDLDGRFTYSTVQQLLLDAQTAAIQLLSNPVPLGHAIRLQVFSPATIRLYNNAGQPLKTQQVQAGILQWPTDGLTPGLYFIKADGQQFKVMIQ
ncbi:MAG: hypothetical protein IT252_08795 [Chitinophagaceae bacterium]|nr:hypothetical protein [Chitinophagaceae bacterium]